MATEFIVPDVEIGVNNSLGRKPKSNEIESTRIEAISYDLVLW